MAENPDEKIKILRLAKSYVPSAIYNQFKEGVEEIFSPKIKSSAEEHNPKDYILLEGRAHGSYEYPDILIAQERGLQNKNWDQAQEALHTEWKFMPTIRQYVDFLSDLRSGKKLYTGDGKKLAQQKRASILDDIIKVRDPWRAEWFDAFFSKQGEQFYIAYHKFNSAGKLEQVQEPLQECLMQDKTPGIDLEDWLQNANEQGLPSPKINQGSLYYWTPRDGRVAGFGAVSDRAGLDCDWGPLGSDSALGVRAGISAEGAKK